MKQSCLHLEHLENLKPAKVKIQNIFQQKQITTVCLPGAKFLCFRATSVTDGIFNDWMFASPQNPCAIILIPSVILLGGGPLGGSSGMSAEPSWVAFVLLWEETQGLLSVLPDMGAEQEDCRLQVWRWVLTTALTLAFQS